MSSLNKAQIIGNVGKDPEIRSFPNGGRVASFSIATSESWKDKSTGEKRERTDWHNVSVTNDALVGIIERFVKKGSKVYIEGSIQTRKYTDKSGVDKYVTEICLKPFHGQIVLLGSKDGETRTAFAEDAPQSQNDEEIPF